MAHHTFDSGSMTEFADDSGYESALDTPLTPVSDVLIPAHLPLHSLPKTTAAVLLAYCDTLPGLLNAGSSRHTAYVRPTHRNYFSKRSSFNASIAWWEDDCVVISGMSQMCLIFQLIEDRVVELRLRYVELKLLLGQAVVCAKSRYTTPTAEEMALGVWREEMDILMAVRRELLG